MRYSRSFAAHFCSAIAILLLLGAGARAQWVSETYPLKAGWNSIWLSQDCSYASLEALLANRPEIIEVWRWNSSGTAAQFTTSPAAPIPADTAWTVWRRDAPTASTLNALTANSAYLVRVADSTSGTITLQLTGKPVAPKYSFQSNGLNFLGFPVETPDSASARSFERFFSFSSVLKSNPAVFGYVGGPLSSTAPRNPASIATPRITSVSRGQAYWVKSDSYTDYYGPLKVTMIGAGIEYGDRLNTTTLRVKNVTELSKNQTVTATFSMAPSATAPAGQPAVAGAVPLLLRGPRSEETLEFTYTPLTTLTRTLAPGEEAEIVLTLNRAAMGGAAGAVFQSILRVTDSLNLTRVDLPVSATTTSFAGLWVGGAVLSKVDQIIGQSVEAGAAAPSNFPLRLIMHRTASGATTLLQQVYVGESNGVRVASVREKAVTFTSPKTTTRLSSANFPLELVQVGNGQLGMSGPLSFSVGLGHNAATNPFVHTYHPDHDNLDARFEQQLPAGKESYNISRVITLNFQPSLPGLNEPSWGSTTLGGTYTETVTGLRSRPITVSGTFILHRVADVPTLVTQ